MKHLKSIFSAMAAVLMISMTATTFTACGDDDDEEEEEKAIETYVAMNYKFEVGETLLKIADISVEYYREGQLVTEKITGTSWSATSGLTKKPTKLGYKVTMTLKKDMEFTKSTYKVKYTEWKYPVERYDQNKNLMNEPINIQSNEEDSDVKQEYLQQYFELYNTIEYIVEE